MMSHLISLLVAGCMAFCSVFAAGAQAAGSPGVAFTAASGSWSVQKKGGRIIAVNSATKLTKTLFTDVDKEDEISHYEVASLVGPLFSVAESLYWEGGAHPGHLARLVTVNLDSGKSPVLLTDLFPEEQIVGALLKDKVVRKALGGKRPTTVAQLVEMADGGCDMSFNQLNESYAFHHIKGGNVAIRIGLPHGCEVMRGNYTELGLYLPKPAALAGFLGQAAKRKTLQGDTGVKPNGDL
jgi:hypothetical protein